MTYIGQQTSQDQNFIQMYNWLFNSIARSAHLNIVAET